MRSAQVASSGITATFSGIGTATPVMHYIFASDRVARWCMTRQRRCRNNFRTDIANGCVETHRTTPQMDAQCSHQTSNYVATQTQLHTLVHNLSTTVSLCIASDFKPQLRPLHQRIASDERSQIYRQRRKGRNVVRYITTKSNNNT